MALVVCRLTDKRFEQLIFIRSNHVQHHNDFYLLQICNETLISNVLILVLKYCIKYLYKKFVLKYLVGIRCCTCTCTCKGFKVLVLVIKYFEMYLTPSLILKPLRVYCKSSSYAVVKKSMGDQRGTKVAPWCKHCSSCGWWKGTSWDKVTLSSEEEIKSLALAVLKLCLSEGISNSVRRKMR